MTERLIEKLDRLGSEAGVEKMTPEIRRFAMLVRADTAAAWPSPPRPEQGCNCNQGQCCHICDPDIVNGWAQPEQEPVAWFSTLPDGRLSIKIVGKPTEGNWEPLYTTPPKRPWVGLTDEEIEEAYAKPTLRKMYQDIEDKLKELNT